MSIEARCMWCGFPRGDLLNVAHRGYPFSEYCNECIEKHPKEIYGDEYDPDVHGDDIND